MTISAAVSVTVLPLGSVRLPDRHPRAAATTSVIQGFAITHPDGVMQRSELVDTPHFTVPDWARVEPERLRLVDGDVALASGVRLVATPGHAHGHQSVVIDHVTVLAGQCCSTCAEFATNDRAVADVHDEAWLSTARDSIGRLQQVGAEVVHLSHGTTPLRSTR